MERNRLSLTFILLSIIFLAIYVVWGWNVSPDWNVLVTRWEILNASKIPILFAFLPALIFWILARVYEKPKKDNDGK